jgi:DNA processing protein
MNDTLIGLVALNLTEAITYDAYRALVEHYGTVRKALAAPQRELTEFPGIGPKTAKRLRELANGDLAVEEIEQARDIGADVVTCEDDRYPHNLQYIEDRPIVLYVRGEITDADAQALAVVGSRRSTIYGRDQAMRFARDLARMGFTIVSGLARGVDKAAHEAALDAGGRTIAVLGSGLTRLHPKAHADLADRIAEQGAVVSEFPLDSAPTMWSFPRRNRIVSGLALGTLVVEAGERSGAQITARLAGEQGKEVFAVPGRLTDRQSWGALRLVQSGAKLVTSPADVVAEFPQVAAALESERPAAMADAALPDLTKPERAVLGAIGNEATPVDEITAASKLAASQVVSTLLVLEMKGVVRQHPGKLFTRIR